MADATVSKSQTEGKYIIFSINDQNFGIAIDKTKEIIGVQEIKPIPNTASYILGVINLRGEVVPVVGVRRKFGMNEKEFDRDTCIIILDIKDKSIGLVVDSVSDLIKISEKDLQSPAEISNASFIKAIANTKIGMITILDVEEIIGSDEIISLGI